MGYSEAELFSDDAHREPMLGEHVKIKDRDDWGKVEKINGNITVVDFNYNKASSFRKPENFLAINKEDITEVMSGRAREHLESEVEIYDTYLRGDVYQYKYTEYDVNGEMVNEESCCGYFGDNIFENGIIDELPDDLVAIIKEKGSKWCHSYDDGCEFEVESDQFQITDEIRKQAINKLVAYRIDEIMCEAQNGDYSTLADSLRGDEFIQYNKLSISDLEKEYFGVFEKTIEESFGEIKNENRASAEIAALTANDELGLNQ